MIPNQMQFIKRVIYQLQRNFGQQVDFYHYISKSIDNNSGLTVVNKRKYNIKNIVRLPDQQFRKVLLGGQYDEDEVTFLFTCACLPRGFVIAIDDYFIYKGRKFIVKDYQVWDGNLAYEVNTRAVETDQLCQIIEVSFQDGVVITQGVIYD